MSDRLLAKLTANRFAEPDPVRWAAAADLCEERGDGREARRWRRLSEWYAPLHQAAAALSRPERRRGVREDVDLGPFVVRMRRAGKTLSVWPVPPEEPPWPNHAPSQYVYWGVGGEGAQWWQIACGEAEADLPRYLTRKVVTLIEGLVAKEIAHGA